MSQHPNFLHPHYPNHVCKLKNALYSLKQALKAWYSHLSSNLIELEFQDSKADTSLFILRNATLTMFVLVDDN